MLPSRASRHPRRLAAAALAAGLACALALVSAHATSAPGQVAIASSVPGAYFDPTDASTRLDLYGARFGQTANGDLTLVIRTHQPFAPRDVTPTPTRMLCLWLRSDAATAPEGRLCVAPDARAKSGMKLRYTTLDHAGQRLGIRDLPVVVRRPRDTMVTASFSPGLLRLAQGRYHWQVRSLDGKVEDRLPSGGEATLDVVIATEPAARLRCFGAASRDPYRRCVNHKLRHAIVPPPEDAIFSQNSPCTPLLIEDQVKPCEFGVPAEDAGATMALIGDSHASHWRAALEVVAQRKHWRGVSITRSGCPFMRAITTLPPARRVSCAAWNDEVPKWLAARPNVDIAIVVAHFAGKVMVPKGSSELETKVAGFKAAWASLPATVKHIVVIRDTPIIGFDANDCVLHAERQGRDAGQVCAVKRSGALRADPAVVAAKRLNSPRVKVVDMTRFLCSKHRCFPVIGGALVYKDDQHITDVFATTLGPYLLGAIDKVLG
ncbi:MAG: hypothetical protein QOJ35_2322 [Solirubrobacteraceae bacterium]|jgi:hypothetical protein|nr:hypothetical protein [Solirubrobacteraceae bacterium]